MNHWAKNMPCHCSVLGSNLAQKPCGFVTSLVLCLFSKNYLIKRYQGKKVNWKGRLKLCQGKVRGVKSGEEKTKTAQYGIHSTQSVQRWSIVMQQVDIHTHLKGDCRGFEALIYPPHSHQHTHIQSHTLYIGASKNLCALSPPQCTIRHIKTHTCTESNDILI